RVAGVDSVTAASALPLAGGSGSLRVETDGRPTVETVQGQYTVVGQDYFQSMGIRLRRGRAFNAADLAAAPAVAIVNERAARVLWPDVDPIGRRVRLNGRDWRSIVAIASDVRQDLLRPAAPEFYVPQTQDPASAMWVAVRTRSDARQFAAGVRAALRELEPGLRISAPATMEETISGYFPGSVVAGIGLFCAAALFFATLGLYGVVSYVVARQTHDFGVRIALGAGPRQIERLVLGHGLKLAGAGAAIGMFGGIVLGRLLRGALVGVETSDPLVFVAVAALLSVVELAACYLPARRATTISPLEALRCQ
ncbi:MAG TPA: ABC transporter permease, partial [Bryobacteraceae bacterium]